MSYTSDLLAQAKHLASKEPQRPRQASLRRAISAAYYALFHYLTSEAALTMVKGAGANELRPVFQRAFGHQQMKRVSKAFASGTLSDAWKGIVGGAEITHDLKSVASAFANLQEARHEADYDLNRRFSRAEAHDLIELAERTAQTWRAIRNTSEANMFLTALLLYDRVPRS